MGRWASCCSGHLEVTSSTCYEKQSQWGILVPERGTIFWRNSLSAAGDSGFGVGELKFSERVGRNQALPQTNHLCQHSHYRMRCRQRPIQPPRFTSSRDQHPYRGHSPYKETKCCLLRKATKGAACNRAHMEARVVPAGRVESWSPRGVQTPKSRPVASTGVHVASC